MAWARVCQELLLTRLGVSALMPQTQVWIALEQILLIQWIGDGAGYMKL
jgi:hypothetical protein